MQEVDITIIGAGVIGLAVAHALCESKKDIVVIEKNNSFGQEASSRNSEVIHAGLYYVPGSLKAETCINGRGLLYEFCAKNNIPHKKLGKLVVASEDEEVKEIKAIYENATKSGVKDLRFLEPAEIKRLEPKVNAKLAIFSPDTGIIDSHSLMDFFYNQAKQRGVTFAFSAEVIDIKKLNDGYEVATKESTGDFFSFNAHTVINCAGINSDRIAGMVGMDTEKLGYKIHYCKGQYFRITNPARFSINHLVYPPPTEASLGIHITPDLAGGLRLGPDAKYIDKIDHNIDESDKPFFFESVKKFLPSLELGDLIPDTAGIRPKLQREGETFRDFVVQEESKNGFPGFINLIGIESPGLTSCLAIAERIKDFVRNAT